MSSGIWHILLKKQHQPVHVRICSISNSLPQSTYIAQYVVVQSSFCCCRCLFARTCHKSVQSYVFSISAYTTGSPGDGLRGPIFLSEPPSNVIIPNNKGAIIPCTVYGNPEPLVTWETDEGNKVTVAHFVFKDPETKYVYNTQTYIVCMPL